MSRFISEAAFQQSVVELAEFCGWRVVHFRSAKKGGGGYATPVSYDGRGWPDLVLVHPRAGQLLVVELKSDTGVLTRPQKQWAEWLTDAGVDYRLWRPSDWPKIEASLRIPVQTTLRIGADR